MHLQVFAYPVMDLVDVQVSVHEATLTGGGWTQLFHHLVDPGVDAQTREGLARAAKRGVELALQQLSQIPF